MSKIADAMDPLNLFHKKKKNKVFVPVQTVAKQGSEVEVAQRRKDTAARLRGARRTTKPIGDDDDATLVKRAKLFGE